MADIVPGDVRSRMMASIRSRDTKPELLLRRELHRRGFRFRLNVANLPGKPDIVFPRFQAVIFAHGCFWHGHDCHLFKLPSTRQDFWRSKIERNKVVDDRAQQSLLELGWRACVVWECSLKGRTRLSLGDVMDQCCGWLENGPAALEIRGQ